MNVVSLLPRPTIPLLALGLVIGPFAAHAQAPAAAPRTPELLGLYPGMPVNAARAMLQKHSSTISISPSNEAGFSLMDGANRDMVEAFSTRPPNDPAVWLIRRSQNISLATPMAKTALLSALRGKYGQETLTMDRGGGGLYLFWIFDQSGRLLPTANQALTGCSGSAFVSNMITGPPQAPNEIEKACFASFFAVTAMLNMRDAELLQAYSVELVNLPYAYRAATVTTSAKNAVSSQARKEDLQKGNKNKPVF